MSADLYIDNETFTPDEIRAAFKVVHDSYAGIDVCTDSDYEEVICQLRRIREAMLKGKLKSEPK
jgi:hypothetical protein